MAAVSSSTSLLCLSRPLIHQPPCSAPTSTVSVAVPLTRCPAGVSPLGCCSRRRGARILAIVNDGSVELEEDGSAVEGAPKGRKRRKQRELYVCNLPRSCDNLELLELFKPFGTVQSAEVSRDVRTGISKGCGFVTMSTMSEANAAIFALDGSDLEGREIRVKFSFVMIPAKEKTKALNSPPKTDQMIDNPHRIYVGNLAWSVTAENLRDFFSQVGTVTDMRLLYDRKGGSNRVYAFIAFSSAKYQKEAESLNGTEIYGRPIMVRAIKE